MSSPMWATADENDPSTSHSGYQVKYLQSDGNDIEWLVDGAKALYEVCDAFCRATKFVYLIAAYFSPGIELVRGHAPDPLSIESISAKYPDVMAKVNEINRSKGVPENTIPLVSLLAAKAEMGVPVRVIMFYPDAAQEKLGGAVDTDQAWAMVTGWSSKIDIQKAMWGGYYEGHEVGAHHMKSAVAGTDDGLVAFCGGIDMAYARWATPSHQYDAPIDFKQDHDTLQDYVPDQKAWIDPSLLMGEWNGLRSVPPLDASKTGSQWFWHDVHARVVGPAAYSLADNFLNRYLNAQSRTNPNDLPKHDDDVKAEVQLYRDSDGALKVRGDGTVPPPWAPADPVTAQILRSYFQWNYPNKPGIGPDTSGDYGIWDAYRNLFSKATKSIFIESQYAFEDQMLTDILAKTIGENKDLRVVIVAPVMPDNYDSDINAHIKQLIDASLTTAGDYRTARVAVLSLVSSAVYTGPNGANRYMPVYVHAKVAVIDEEWTIIGSANLDRMGMGGKGDTTARGSSELAVLVHSTQKARELLDSLSTEHSGFAYRDFGLLFDDFVHVASANGRENLLSYGHNLAGQLVWHRVYDTGPTPIPERAPFVNGQAASLVLGQQDFTHDGQATTATGMKDPTGVSASLDGSVWVADSQNNRVIGFSQKPSGFTSGQAADVVLGQPDFVHSDPATTQTGVRTPNGVSASPYADVWVADTGNNRVLQFQKMQLPGPGFTSGEMASRVYPGPDFAQGSPATAKAGMRSPTGVGFGPLNATPEMNSWVADAGNNRVLARDGYLDQAADLVFGQPDFDHSGQAATATGMSDPTGITVDKSSYQVWVADSGNNRVLRFTIAVSGGRPIGGPIGGPPPAADLVLGQPDFTHNSAAATATGMSDPGGVALDPYGNLWVVDAGNNRVLRFTKGPNGFASGQAADIVLGQQDFTHSGPETAATSLNGPTGVSVDALGNVWVADAGNNRVIQFAAWRWPPSPPSPPSG